MRLDWDAVHYADRLPKRPQKPQSKAAEESEAHLRKRFPPLDVAASNPRSSPCIIVDRDDVILAWYLPGILDASRQVSIFNLSDHHNTLMYFRKQ